MGKVENQETLWLLTRRFMGMNRGRNRIAVLAIALTTLLFTSLFTGAASMVLSKLEADKKNYGTWCHAVLQDVTREEAERAAEVLRRSAFVECFGTDLFVGLLQDVRLPFLTEVRTVDFYGAKAFDCIPEKGRLPEKGNEIALSTIVLDALGISPAYGAEIPLRIGLDTENGDVQIADSFVLCGWWEGDVSARSQFCWVSEEFAKKAAPAVNRSALENGAKSGAAGLAVWYKHVYGLQEKTEALGEDCGFLKESEAFVVNPAYAMLSEEDGVPLGAVGFLILLIMLAGYLIIYNIFSISVKTDIRTYGLLKNVGTTGKQLARIVRQQAFCLCLMGIPAGLLAGYGCGIWIAPSLTADVGDITGQAKTVIYADTTVFAAAAAFAFITVYLSCWQACRIVSRVSPAEALRIAEGAENPAGRPKRKKETRGLHGTWQAMALHNFWENRKKGGLVVLSIALCLVTCNGIWMMVQGYSLESYQATYMASDFELDKLPDLAEYAQLDGIAGEQQEVLKTCPYAQSVGLVRYSRESHEMEPQLLRAWEQMMGEDGAPGAWWQEVWERTKAANKMEITLMGIDRSVFEKLIWRDDEAAWEAFQSGKYILVDYPLFSRQKVSNYRKGDRFLMEYQSGVQKEYEVLAEARLPYSLDYPYTNLICVTVLVPEAEFIACTGKTTAMRACLDASYGREEELQDYLEDRLLAQDGMLRLHSVLDLRASFARFLDKYYMAGGALAVVLAGIGVMNFFNTMAASVLSRKRELALLEAVGMTKRQIQKMLVAEGLLYLGSAFLLSVLLTLFCGERLINAVLGQAFFFRIRVTVLPCVLLLPALAAVAILIPKRQLVRVERESVTERLLAT